LRMQCLFLHFAYYFAYFLLFSACLFQVACLFDQTLIWRLLYTAIWG
jgi:hypothetical protein